MKKKIITTGLGICIFLSTVIVVYAITNLFMAKSQTSELSKKQIFQFDMDIGMSSGEVGPGDSFSLRPVIYNDATEEMFVFVELKMPTTDNGILYLFDADEDWCLVSENAGTAVYAYGTDEMTVLCPGESTSALTNQMTMRSISNAEYAAIDDINITVTGYAVGIEGVSTNPTEAWNECKAIGNLA